MSSKEQAKDCSQSRKAATQVFEGGVGQGEQDLVSVAGLCRRVADPKPQLAGIAATEKGGVLVGKLYRGTGGGGGARANVRALADRGSSGGERERRGLGSEKAGEGGKGDGPAGREGGEWMEEPRDAGEGHLAEGEASTRVGEAGGLAGLGHLAAGEESTRVGDAGGGVR